MRNAVLFNPGAEIGIQPDILICRTDRQIAQELDLVEVIEITDHPHFIGCQFHPEFQSKPFAPHPLFSGFIRAAVTARDAKSL